MGSNRDGGGIMRVAGRFEHPEKCGDEKHGDGAVIIKSRNGYNGAGSLVQFVHRMPKCVEVRSSRRYHAKSNRQPAAHEIRMRLRYAVSNSSRQANTFTVAKAEFSKVCVATKGWSATR